MLTVKCPQCKKEVGWTADEKFKPFCSHRCRLIDLGEWIMEEKRIEGESLQEYDENLQTNEF